jgi:Meiotically up-regulated gene 113
MENEVGFADHQRTTFAELRRVIPLRISEGARGHLRGFTDKETGHLPIYDSDGILQCILLKDYKREVRPVREGPCQPFWVFAHRQADEIDRFGYCYFIGGDHGAIKIGHTVNVADRLRTIQSHSPIPLKVLAVVKGSEPRESAYHHQFAEHRLHGEWFSRHPDILAEIERLAQTHGGADGLR